MIVIFIVAFLSSAAGVGLFMHLMKNASSSSDDVSTAIKTELESKKALQNRITALQSELVPASDVASVVLALKDGQDKLKAERGRITITQAELETVETRLRELEEIERELEASGLETKEELNILQRKHQELSTKNAAVKQQIEDSQEQWQQLITEMESNAQVAERIQAAKNELIRTEEQVTSLMLQIEQGNDQYFVLKRRYDALDIEYAQLYEKFTEAEAMVNNAKESANN